MATFKTLTIEIKASISPKYRDTLLKIAKLTNTPEKEYREMEQSLNELVANYEGERSDDGPPATR